jgi:HK97 family phage portal protein
VLSNLFGERRSITYASLWAAGDTPAFNTRAGVAINEDNSLKIAAVYAAVRLIADLVCSLPVDTYRRIDGRRVPYRPRPLWVDQPEPDLGIARSDHFQSLLVGLMVDGNAFLRVIRSQSTGDIVALPILDPTRVEVVRAPDKRIGYRIQGSPTLLTESDVVHITELRRPGSLRGVSRIKELRETLGLGSALEQFAASFFGSGSTTSGIIEVPQEIASDQAKALQDAYEAGHKGLRKAHRPGILSGGAKWVKTGVDPNEAQMLESQKFAVETVCRMFRIPPHLLQVTEPGAMSYASVEENARQFVTFTLLPYIYKLEEAYTRLLPAGVFLKFNLDALLRGSTESRYAAHSSALLAGWSTINEVRVLEDRAPFDNPAADAPRVPLANVNIDGADIVELDKKVAMAQKLVVSGYDPQDVLRALELPDMGHLGLPSVQLQPPT